MATSSSNIDAAAPAARGVNLDNSPTMSETNEMMRGPHPLHDASRDFAPEDVTMTDTTRLVSNRQRNARILHSRSGISAPPGPYSSNAPPTNVLPGKAIPLTDQHFAPIGRQASSS